MRVHYLQHVPFESLGSIESFLIAKGHTITCTKLYDNQTLPPVKNIDCLIVMGGPMGIYDEDEYPWLKAEKKFIDEAISLHKFVLGICLGAQLIADVLGAKVYKNEHKEIGWFNITRSSELEATILSKAIPQEIEVFHWHGDTFDIPVGAVPIAKSQACRHQGFIKDDHVVAFQFHLETTFQSAQLLIENCFDDMDSSTYVQSKKQILSNSQRFLDINAVMSSVLETIAIL